MTTLTTARDVATAAKWTSLRNIRVVINVQWQRPLGNETESVAIVGSGNNWGDVLRAAAAVGRTLVTGQDRTVGVEGLLGGGGHGPLSSHYGLAADQVLQATVVTTEGRVPIPNEAQNQDLLWAICGGGPGLYGIVTDSQDEGGNSRLIFGLQSGLGPKRVEAVMRGALNPAWRNAYVYLIATGVTVSTTDTTPQDALATAALWAEENKEAVWRRWAPDPGAYINEANPFNGNFRKDFYGGNYDRLLEIKQKYDPTASLHIQSGMGSHLWDYNLNSGKLCRK
ncbi:hypothetical protein NKR23_g11217 [Pleurostoma richardsiae]|uniref:FAD-binding PCMH-type domain-containing protein n=1 Tax=Pleurostoma richardsiae TaxID=41990 RepID=A0AA38R1L5_9PEZI|nr:hypothetical protein NKR23_g11217 [Pleurostoma richardsiae]